jgi:hypothetical protein
MQKLRSSFIVLAMKNVKKNGDDIEVIRNLEQAGKSCQLLNRFANDAGIRLDAAGEWGFCETHLRPNKRVTKQAHRDGGREPRSAETNGKAQRGRRMDFDLSARSEHWRERLQSFFDREVLPRHRAWLEHVAVKREPVPFMGDLQDKARAAGLWNLGLPELGADEPGTRLTNLEYAPLAEIMGRLFWAPEVFNCQAPDVPNMIALQNCATAEQK